MKVYVLFISRIEVAYLIFLGNLKKKKWSPKKVQDIRNAKKPKQTKKNPKPQTWLMKKKQVLFFNKIGIPLCVSIYPTFHTQEQ